jgi:hypothetical protein
MSHVVASTTMEVTMNAVEPTPDAKGKLVARLARGDLSLDVRDDDSDSGTI